MYLPGSKYGIYTVLDMHQDEFSYRFCGEGVPAWATQGRVSGFLEYPFPLEWAFPIDNFTGIPNPEMCEKLSWSLG